MQTLVKKPILSTDTSAILSPQVSRISVVVPVYRSEGTVRQVALELVNSLSEFALEFEIIFVNDCSPDNSWKELELLAGEFSEVRLINLSKNFGQHNALLCGIRAAKYDVIATIDDDLQNPPVEIIKLLQKLDEGFDVVYGTPRRQQHGLFRNYSSQITKLVLSKAMGASTASNISSFRVFRRSARRGFDSFVGPNANIDVLLTWATTRFASVPVTHFERTVGSSTYTIGKLITHATNMLTGFSVLPLRLASLNGALFVAVGLVLLGYVCLRYCFQGCPVPGFPFLASIVIIFSGAQMFTLGIIGEYLARMYVRSMDQPTYVIASTVEQTSA